MHELQKINDEVVSAEELERAKQFLLGKMLLSMEDSEQVAEFYGMQQLLEGKIEPTDEAAIKSFNEKLNEVFETEESTKGLLSIPLDGLNLDVNQISPSILAVLEPIVTEEAAPAAK